MESWTFASKITLESLDVSLLLTKLTTEARLYVTVVHLVCWLTYFNLSWTLLYGCHCIVFLLAGLHSYSEFKSARKYTLIWTSAAATNDLEETSWVRRNAVHMKNENEAREKNIKTSTSYFHFVHILSIIAIVSYFGWSLNTVRLVNATPQIQQSVQPPAPHWHYHRYFPLSS